MYELYISCFTLKIRQTEMLWISDIFYVYDKLRNLILQRSSVIIKHKILHEFHIFSIQLNIVRNIVIGDLETMCLRNRLI